MKRQERAARGEDGLVADCDRRIDQLCATCRELLEADPGSKWANLTLGLLLLARGSFPTGDWSRSQGSKGG